MGTLRGGSEKAPSPLDSRTASRLQLRLARRIAVAGDDGVDGQQGACRGACVHVCQVDGKKSAAAG